ncbi:glycoside hydrolase family protein [Brevundimonas sp. FT23028]|uniref:lysozyme n=1 Tax=Brevundimonas sp. FT23028 TaxID=3393748 RepID=UPI003B587ACC
MLEPNRPRLKISRAGIVLIKSFESFRPRAVQREDGRWVIGYGHTASAREGLTVGEQDAELLLQYDLIPVARALNEQVEPELNQHQFDALASFAVSVGVDRFLASDVLNRINAGQSGEAADALMGWPVAIAADAALRRRAAERALFVADPAAPVLLADLLAAPLPPPAIVEETPATPPVEDTPAPDAPDAGDATDAAPLSRAEAVASLLGETATPETVDDAPAAEVAGETPGTAPTHLPLPSVWAPQTVTDVSAPPASAFLHRYSPYSAMIVGPLPGFPSAAPAPQPAVDAPAADGAPEPTPEPTPEPIPETGTGTIGAEAADAPAEAPAAEEPLDSPPPAFAHPIAPLPAAPEAPLEMPVFAPTASPFPPLELTPAVEADFAEAERPVWSAEQRAPATEAEETVLFEDEPPLAVLRHEVEPASPRRFDWIETGPYMIMGGLGLFSCAASAAAFRKAMTDRSPLDDFTVIAWVLALIGVICVGVSAWNLYRKAGKRDGDKG